MKKENENKRMIIVHKVLNGGSEKDAMKTIDVLRKSIGDVYDYMIHKYNSMSIDQFEEHLRMAYQEDGDNSFEPTINRVIVNEIIGLQNDK